MAKCYSDFFKLKDDIQLFMEEKGNPVFEFDDAQWICDLAFFVNITSHLNELNFCLQRKEQLISSCLIMSKPFWSNYLFGKNR